MNYIKKRLWSKFFLRFYIFYLRHINRQKLKNNLFFRKEKKLPTCISCNICCNRCYALNRHNGLCTIWDTTAECKDFPITPLQLEIFNIKDKCRYYWDNNYNSNDFKPNKIAK